MNDSGDFQYVESIYSGRLSHVSSAPVMISSSRSLPSRDKRLPLGTWNQSGVQEKVFGNQFATFDLPRHLTRRIQSDDVQRNREAVPEARRTKTFHTSEDRLNRGTIPMPTFATRPLTTSSQEPVDIQQNYVVGQQRQQISELHFDKFPDPSSFLVWKTRFKTQVSSGSDFPPDAMLWIKEVEMVDSLDELKSSRSVSGKDFQTFEMLDAKIALVLNKIIQNSQFKKNTWVWSTQNRIGIVRHGDSSEDIGSKLSEVEIHGKEEYRSETSIAKFWRWAWENWIRSSDQESKGIVRRWRRKRYLLPVERKRPVFARRPLQFPPRKPRSCAKTQNALPPHLLSQPLHEVEVCRRKEVSEAKVTMVHSSTTVQILLEWYLYANVLWILASAWVPILLKQKRVASQEAVFVSSLQGWWTTE